MKQFVRAPEFALGKIIEYLSYRQISYNLNIWLCSHVRSLYQLYPTLPVYYALKYPTSKLADLIIYHPWPSSPCQSFVFSLTDYHI